MSRAVSQIPPPPGAWSVGGLELVPAPAAAAIGVGQVDHCGTLFSISIGARRCVWTAVTQSVDDRCSTSRMAIWMSRGDR